MGGGRRDGAGGSKRKSIVSSSRASGIEENTLAILDAYEDSHEDSRYSHDDRLAFLEAVRAASIVAENGTPPTNKMLEAIFRILRTGSSMESIMASFQLLNELEKQFPRAHLSAGGTDEPSSITQPDLQLLKEAWSPFAVSSDTSYTERAASNKSSFGPVDPSGFNLLIQELARLVDHQTMSMKSLRNMLLLQYLINVLEEDFSSRIRFYKETMDWTILRESLLNLLLSSRRISCKGLLKDCVSALCGLWQLRGGFVNDPSQPVSSVAKSSEEYDTSLVLALVHGVENVCSAMQKFLAMSMEFDVLRKEADMQGHTMRADGVRTPPTEVILEELIYIDDILSSFLQVFNQPKWKLELALQYLSKYVVKPSVRTRRSSDASNDATLCGILKCLSNASSSRSIVKKIGAETVQLLLAHAFQAELALSSKDDSRNSSLMEACEHILSAFESLRQANEHMDILPIGKEAILVASTILSIKS